MTEEHWGPWIKHTSDVMPVAGNMIVDVWLLSDAIYGYEFEPAPAHCWDWVRGDPDEITRYRIRYPRALQQLRDLIENLPEKVGA